MHIHVHGRPLTWSFSLSCFSSVTNTHLTKHNRTHTHSPTGWWLVAGGGWRAGTECGRITTLLTWWLHCCVDNYPCRIAWVLGCGKSNWSSPSVSLSVYFSQTGLSDFFFCLFFPCYVVSFFSLFHRHCPLSILCPCPCPGLVQVAFWGPQSALIRLKMFKTCPCTFILTIKFPVAPYVTFHPPSFGFLELICHSLPRCTASRIWQHALSSCIPFQTWRLWKNKQPSAKSQTLQFKKLTHNSCWSHSTLS